MWCTMPNRLEASIQMMTKVYGQFAYETDCEKNCGRGIWRGSVQPIKVTGAQTELLDDLFHDRAVYVVGDEVRHLPSCTSTHCRHDWMDKASQLTRRFDLAVSYDGGIALPRCHVVHPVIPLEKRRHMWSDGAICAFLASERVWSWNRDTVASFLPHVFIWLVKWMVFDQTAVWIGSEHCSDPVYHLQHIGLRDPCWCGRGLPYRKCHYRQDLAALRRGRIHWSS